MKITKAAVIGAGTMGSGIAAHLANAGVEVVLLDLEANMAASGVKRQLRAGGFMDPAFADKVKCGSVLTDLDMVADADWIVEAVAERADIKRDLFLRLQEVRKPSSIVSSNTSTIPLQDMLEGLPDSFAQQFLITHFFNPPRRMRLLEVVVGPATRGDVVTTISEFGDVRLGKGVVYAKDTPGFIANRIGVYWMAAAEHEAVRLGLDVEEADAFISKPFGIPQTGVFGLLDLVGIDVMQSIVASLTGALPPQDPLFEYAAISQPTLALIAAGRTGRKAGAGFTRLSADKSREVLDLQTGEYRPHRPVAADALNAAKDGARTLMEHSGKGPEFASLVMEKTLAYAASLVPDIADTPDLVDKAMRLGFAWKLGPFELIDQLGPDWLGQRLKARGLPAPALLDAAASAGGFYGMVGGERAVLAPGEGLRPIIEPDGVFSLADLKRHSKPVVTLPTVDLWDMGDGVGLVEIRSKLNTFSGEVLVALRDQIINAKNCFAAVLIGGEGAHFSAGADLRALLASAELGPEALNQALELGQTVFQAIKFAPMPIVAAARGLALGGGCEITLHCSAVQADAELNIGLVETNVGLIPGWGGCKEMLLRLSATGLGPVEAALSAFNLIRRAGTSTSAFDARQLGYLRADDAISMNQDRLLADAKARVLQLVDGYAPPKAGAVALSGADGMSALTSVINAELQAGKITEHDHTVGMALAAVLTGGIEADVGLTADEDALLRSERDAFVDLFNRPLTRDRIRHMLAVGKPLKN